MTLWAYQLIYTRLEADLSARRWSGFQVAYASPALTPPEISAVEQRMQCFNPPDPGVRRYQFFVLAGGRFVLSQTVALDPQAPSYTTTVDRTGRTGAFLAHALIFEPHAFERVQFNPFAVFQHPDRPFLTQVSELADQFADQSRLSAEVPVPIMDGELQGIGLALAWPAEERIKLGLLANQAQSLTQARRTVLILGDHVLITAILRFALESVLPQRRQFCSFDTCIDRCTTQATNYWAVGSASRLGGTFVEVDGSARRVPNTGPLPKAEDDLYFGWFEQALAQSDERFVNEYAPAIQDIAAYFLNPQASPPRRAPLAYWEFFQVHQQRITQTVGAALTTQLSGDLASALITYLLDNITPETAQSLVQWAAQRQIPADQLSDVVTDWLATHPSILREHDWKLLQKLAAQVHNAELLFLTAVLAKKGDSALREDALQQMDIRHYETLYQVWRERIDPALFATKDDHKVILLLQHLPKNLLSQPQMLVDLIRSLIDVGLTRRLNDFVGDLPYLDGKMLHQLEVLIKKRTDIPERFRSAVNAQREKLGSRAPLDRLRGFLRREGD